MRLEDFIKSYLLTKSPEILGDATESKIGEALAGLNGALEGLSEDSITQMFVETKPFKSYVDKRLDHGLGTRERNLRTEFDKEKLTLSNELEQLKSSNATLKANTPLSADPAKLREQALDEVDPTKREILNMRADNIEFKNQLAERTAIEEKQLQELTREKLVNVARTELGERHLPKSLAENLHMFIGSDEETTKGKMKNFNTEWDDFTKDMRTAGVDPVTPSGTGEPDRDPEEVMREKMSRMDF